MFRNWKPNARQQQILNVLEQSPTPMAPSTIGEACGQPAGAVASKWTYHALVTLVAKGKVVKKGVGLYENVVIIDKLEPSNDTEPDATETNGEPGTEG